MEEVQFPTIQSIRQLSYIPTTMKEPPEPKIEPLSNERAVPTKLETLREKLKSGKKLTEADMEYLRSHDPELYSKALMLNMERANYDNAVRQSRTKSDANTFHMQTLMSISKLGHDTEESLMRVSAVQDSHRNFVRSSEYASLAWN
jgi:hypothetical protein